MLRTIEVEIDAAGFVRPIDNLSFRLRGRALLTLLDAVDDLGSEEFEGAEQPGDIKKVLELLATSRFQKRPSTSVADVSKRISEARNGWD